MLFHIFRASDSSTIEIPTWDDEEDIAAFKSNPPTPAATIAEGKSWLGSQSYFWQIEVNTVEEVFAIHPKMVLRGPDRDTFDLPSLQIFDGYID